MKARPLQKKENAVQTRATVFQNLSPGNIFKRRTCLVAFSWICMDMVPFHFVFIYLMLKGIYGLIAFVSITHRSPMHKRLEGTN